MIVKTASRTYEVNSYGYGATLPTGERTFACSIKLSTGDDPMVISKDVACGSLECYTNDLLTETITGFTKVRQYSCTISDNTVTEIHIIIQEPGIQAQIDLLTTALNEVLFSVLPGLEGE